MVDVRVFVGRPSLKRSVLCLGEDMELGHEERGLRLGEGCVHLDKGVRLGEGMFA